MGLIIDDKHHANWTELCPSARRYLIGFLGASGATPTAPWPAVSSPGSTPVVFRTDLGSGGQRLRAAFPSLERRVIAIDLGIPATVRVRCRGRHEGAFYGFLRPTGRCVEFDEVHSLVVAADAVRIDVVEIDLPDILRQLAP